MSPEKLGCGPPNTELAAKFPIDFLEQKDRTYYVLQSPGLTDVSLPMPRSSLAG